MIEIVKDDATITKIAPVSYLERVIDTLLGIIANRYQMSREKW